MKLKLYQIAEIAKNSELVLAQPKLNDKSIAPYFVDSITKELTTRFDRDYLNTNFNTRCADRSKR